MKFLQRKIKSLKQVKGNTALFQINPSQFRKSNNDGLLIHGVNQQRQK